MSSKKRKMGIQFIDNAPWGAHFCLFYETKEDLLDMLIPYFKAGLENNEYCMWVTSEPLNNQNALIAATKSIPNFKQYLKKKQIEIIPHDEWYLKDNVFDLQSVLNNWIEKLDDALKNGFDGLRVTGNTAWLEKKDWKKFTDYEEEINNVISGRKMMAICTYSLEKCGSYEILDVIRNHQFALVRREGKWTNFKSVEQSKVEEKVKESEEKYGIFFEESPCPIGIVDFTGKIIDVNRYTCTLSGYQKGDFIGKNFKDLPMIPKESMLTIANMFKTLEKGKIPEPKEIQLYNKTGDLKWVYIQSSLIKLEEKQLIQFITQNINELKESEKKYREAYNLVNFYKDLFTHDMNNILQSILSSAEYYYLFREDYDKLNGFGDISEVIKTHTGRGVSLINTVRKLSELDESEIILNPIGVFNVLNKSVENAKKSFYQKNKINIKTEGLSKDTKILGDELLIDVFDNILNNAVKFSDDKVKENVIDIIISKIHVEDTNYLKFEFKDSGSGIPDDRKETLFERPYERDRSKRGMGMGLSLVKKIVDKYDGKIWVEDRIKGNTKEGSNFVVLLKEAH